MIYMGIIGLGHIIFGKIPEIQNQKKAQAVKRQI